MLRQLDFVGEWDESYRAQALDVVTRGVFNASGTFISFGLPLPDLYLGLELVDELPSGHVAISDLSDLTTTAYFTQGLLDSGNDIGLIESYTQTMAHEASHIGRASLFPFDRENQSILEVIVQEGIAYTVDAESLRELAPDSERVFEVDKIVADGTAYDELRSWLDTATTQLGMTMDEAITASVLPTKNSDGSGLDLPVAFKWGILEIGRRRIEGRTLRQIFLAPPKLLLGKE